MDSWMIGWMFFFGSMDGCLDESIDVWMFG